MSPSLSISDEDLNASLLYFPLVGLLIGGFLAVIAQYLQPFFSPLLLAALLLFILILLTGGLHLDGLADLSDGLGAGGGQSRILSVMKESQIGAFGVIAVVMILLLKFSLFYEIIYKELLGGFFLMGLLSRWSMVFAAFFGKYPRKAGTGKAFIGLLSPIRGFTASLGTILIAYLNLQGNALVVMALLAIMSFLFVRYLHTKIGGLTGDALGAVNEISEVVILIFVVLTPKTTLLFLN